MNPGYGLGMFQQQSVKLHMTPQLRLAVRILQMPTPELLEYIRQELDNNPLLEAASMSWNAGGYRSSGFDPAQAAAARDLTLEQHLMQQLGLMREVSGNLRRITAYLIGNLDANGYLEIPLDQVCHSLQAGREETDSALRILQGLEPAGVGAADLAECLLLQLRRLPDYPPLVEDLIQGHLEDIAGFRIRKLAKLFHVPEREIEAAIGVIKGLEPRPGAAYQPADIRYVVPDLIIEADREFFAVTVPDTAAPRLSIQEEYRRLARQTGKNDDAGKFLHARLGTAVFLIKCLEQRRSTLLRVGNAILEEQEAFFRKGMSGLKPMILKQIAGKLALHESTVSRAVSGKFARTPWGTFELAYFFPSGFNKGREDAASAEAVKVRIRDRVKNEDNHNPYSDRQLADLLAEEGIPVARRTVMKYREALGIPSSVRRKIRF